MERVKHAVWIASLLMVAGTGSFGQGESEWGGWSSFGVGSYAVFESEGSLFKKEKWTVTLVEKGDAGLTLETTREQDGETKKTRHTLVKPSGKGDQGTCKCGKALADHSKTSDLGKEKVKVGDKELECAVLLTTGYDCDGVERTSFTSWLNPQVPGGRVKRISKLVGGEQRENCLAFDTK